MLKSDMEGSRWWKSLQCLSIAEVVDLEFFFFEMENYCPSV